MGYKFKIQPQDHGIICSQEDEKAIVKNLNKYLASYSYRKMYKSQDHSLPPPSMPDRKFRISHYYAQFMKETPRWHFDIKPNCDLDGKYRFPDHRECGWILHTRPVMEENYSTGDTEKVKDFFSGLISNVGFDLKLLHSYANANEDRL